MLFSRILRVPRLRRGKIIASLILCAMMFIIYQLAFVAELSLEEKHKYKLSSEKKHTGISSDPPKILNSILEKNFESQNEEPKFLNKEIVPGSKSKLDIKNENKVNINLVTPVDKASLSTSGSEFKCKLSGKVLPSDKVNDDYCDCPEDGSDEPLTNACDKSIFICKSSNKNSPSTIPSNWVNDGVCDCCDGSDEWHEKKLNLPLPMSLQKKINRFLSPCPSNCIK